MSTERTTAAPIAQGMATLPAELRLGAVHLTVTDLDPSVAFYGDVIGLRVERREDATAALGSGDGREVVVLVEEPGARQPGRHAGLFHVALLYPSRLELARTLQRIAATRTPIDGASDHGTHEAIYLSDLDGNGLELAADRPRERWPEDLGYDRGPAPLDLDGLLELVAGAEPQPRAEPGLAVGHLHLHMGDVEEALAFYRDSIGFELMARLPSAAFVAAGGYHHHLGFNVWRGHGVPPAPEGVVGLRHWTVELPSADDVAAVAERVRFGRFEAEERDDGVLVRDPWNMALLVTTAGAG
ncbi:MAG TPA: VOC family protein [Thermoleophilaceae bacterium]|nr:VOC family protein [Thermoleophilaceae bacterium]